MQGIGSNEERECETRPGGMVVQRRDDEESVNPNGPNIKIKVSHGNSSHDVIVPSQSTFGNLKRVLAQEIGLDPREQRLLFRGKEKEDDEYLHMAGVKDMSKVLLMEDPASVVEKLGEMKISDDVSKACVEVSKVRSEVDKLAERVFAVEGAMLDGTKLEEKEFLVLTELLMVQLLKLDGVEAEGEARVQRKDEVRRIQGLVETLDALKARNSNPFGNASNAVTVTTQWETFDSGVGGLRPPPPAASSTRVTQDWEHFD
ncbi:BAG domain [Dillenia turbinata]|uniref:BAG domain n=1 Tax=Dillenia turbinata TaxID=194707 RepID=A0AAN8ZMF4_9MAGN